MVCYGKQRDAEGILDLVFVVLVYDLQLVFHLILENFGSYAVFQQFDGHVQDVVAAIDAVGKVVEVTI